MQVGALRDRTSRLRTLVAGAAAVIALAGGAFLVGVTSGVAHAAPLLAPTAATPTLDPLIVPTSAPGQTLSNGVISTGSGGIELAVMLSCATSIVGLIIAALTLTSLVRTGYGPFLRALLPRWLRRKVPDPAEQPVLRYQPGPNNPQTGFDLYAEAPSPRGGRRHAPRDEWADRSAPPQRQMRSGQAVRGSSRGGGRSRY
ncbi:MAG TPA: hypothetical protein VFQ25_05755 [Ktedonobacterales bacterium]|nr:hypothetical protein [Ktedonobacterales bacterium]